MSQYNKSEEFWKSYTTDNIQIIKKIGEKNQLTTCKRKNNIYNYNHPTDILLVKCSCGYEYQMLAHSLLRNTPKKCRRCGAKKDDIVGKIINNLSCIDYYHKKNVNNNRSIIWVNLICQTCLCKSSVQSSIFRKGNIVCNNCVSEKHASKRVGAKTTVNRYFISMKKGANKRNIEFNITVEDILTIINNQNNKCILSGLDISFNDGSLSVDRIDSKQGYTVDNIQCVHRDVNYMKSTYSQERFLEICYMVTTLNKRT